MAQMNVMKYYYIHTMDQEKKSILLQCTPPHLWYSQHFLFHTHTHTHKIFHGKNFKTLEKKKTTQTLSVKIYIEREGTFHIYIIN